MKMNEGAHIQIGEIREALETNKDLAESPRIAEDNWSDYDSPLEKPREHSFPMAVTFSKTLPDEYKAESEEHPVFKGYIEETLSSGESQHPLTGVEFGGTGSSLFGEFTKDFFEATVGVCLEDIRDDQTKKDDEANHHFVITGNALDTSYLEDNETAKKVIEKLGTPGVDLIICRMSGPLSWINKNGAILDRIIRNWYEILNYNGLMFVQFDRGGSDDVDTVDLVNKWVEAIKGKFPQLDIQIEGGAMRLHKTDDSPEYLPPATKLFS